MGREPQGYTVWGGVLQVANDLYLVTVRATAVDLADPAATFMETAKVETREAAREKQFEMIRELSARLTAQGHTVVDVEADF
jgi:hypothetical protein